MKVRLTQLDGKLPNVALMRLSRWHKERGDEVYFTRQARRDMFEPDYDRVYGSVLFSFSKPKLDVFRRDWPDAIVGGTGSGNWDTLETLGLDNGESELDYDIYPDTLYSIGFLQRGCRLKCKFCVVPQKEGAPRFNQSVNDLWRGDPYPRKLHILDNDFFGVPEWRRNIQDILDGGFRVCLSQGINVRLIDDEAAEALGLIQYRCSKFKRRRLYTAWDNLGQEKIFMRGIGRLMCVGGIPAHHIMAYMLIGYAKGETLDDIMYRFKKMVDIGIKPYPMVYDPHNKRLKQFQRWAVTGLYRVCSFEEYRHVRASDGDSEVGDRVPG